MECGGRGRRFRTRYRYNGRTAIMRRTLTALAILHSACASAPCRVAVHGTSDLLPMELVGR